MFSGTALMARQKHRPRFARKLVVTEIAQLGSLSEKLLVRIIDDHGDFKPNQEPETAIQVEALQTTGKAPIVYHTSHIVGPRLSRRDFAHDLERITSPTLSFEQNLSPSLRTLISAEHLSNSSTVTSGPFPRPWKTKVGGPRLVGFFERFGDLGVTMKRSGNSRGEF
ncbi:hypothetical protein K504DRAFT_500658 [Pleomassaria siparia CBS 279.74]|uniref:Uncharacterized protein n=1 Tax=Pleomassaria siparia CBS 279.74 TaxID=1314801 RepID=A0A6G1KDK1_9PLEO|nr:hypothetical protein K504DRAFT_500658 [Pleomassaria siparia CBS 279.74]